ncbi:hypothetical protein [Haloparvum sedimenti]|uniref:hypothetical protein n=1 Tax=Haloparvum sedimenti TaxID=1678448 RepID=UPI00071E8028|nr:hypothetical protein [Haloparvum sedimenti]
MSKRLGPTTAVAVLLVVLAVSAVGPAALVGSTPSPEPAGEPTFHTVRGEGGTENRTAIWPFTSRARAFETRTLPLNLIVEGDVAETRRHLERSSRGDWNETRGDFEDEGVGEGYVRPNGTATAWGQATGSTRLTYVVGPGERLDEGQWLLESYQLHDGDYLGARHHIRAYAAPNPDEEWTAMQAHREHWDWFRLRHTVGSVEESQSYVEREFMGRWFVEDVYRTYVGAVGASDADGWLTVVQIGAEGPTDGTTTSVSRETIETTRDDGSGSGIESATGTESGAGGVDGVLPAGAVLLAVAAVHGRWRDLAARVDEALGPTARRALSVATALVVTFLFVRFASVGLERTTPIPPKVIAAALYPFLFAGLPTITYLLSRQLDRPIAFSAASIGFLTAVFLDYTYLGVTVLPLDALVHRGGLAVALGFIAVGASRPERLDPEPSRHVRLGVLLWLVTLVLPLLRFV